MTAIEEILSVCKRIKNNRSISTIFRHLEGEVEELHDEVINHIVGAEPGPDGIIGEAVDVILCAVDAAVQANPDLTEEQIREIITRKLEKWERVYG